MRKHLRWLLVAAAGLSVIPAYLHAYTFAGPSDIPTVLLGDTVVVNTAAYEVKLPYSKIAIFRSGSPKRGDLVLLRLPSHPRLKTEFVKRIMGLPGEILEMRENQLIINGRAIPARWLNPGDFAWVPRAHPIGSVVQDEDGHWSTFSPGKGEHRNHPPTLLSGRQYFVLGDNRDDSDDSREFGPVSEDVLLGKIVVTLATGERTK